MRECIYCLPGAIVHRDQCLTCAHRDPHFKELRSQWIARRLMKIRHAALWLTEFGYPEHTVRKTLMRFAEFCIVACFLTACSGYTYNGIRADQSKTITWKYAAGIATTMAVHAACHIAYAEMIGQPWHIEGSSEIVDGTMGDSDAANFGRAGFVGQLAVGYAMRAAGWDNDFVQGYNFGTAFEIATYPLYRNWIAGGGDDFGMIDRDGNPWLEWGVYTALSAGLNFDTK